MGNQRGRPMKARPRILQTARELFLSHGLDVSLDTIAAEAGTTRPGQIWINGPNDSTF